MASSKDSSKDEKDNVAQGKASNIVQELRAEGQAVTQVGNNTYNIVTWGYGPGLNRRLSQISSHCINPFLAQRKTNNSSASQGSLKNLDNVFEELQDNPAFQNHYTQSFETYYYEKGFTENYNRVLQGTFQWLLDHQVLAKWSADEEPDAQLLWLTGVPGLGKTSLAASLIHLLKERFAADDTENNNGVLYCFCQDGVHYLDGSAVTILSTVIHQFFTAFPDLCMLGFNEERSSTSAPLDFSTQRHPGYLWRLLCNVVQKSGLSRVFIIIDGINACPPQVQLELLLLFTQIPDEASSIIRVMVSCPPMESLRVSLEQSLYRKLGKDHPPAYLSFDILRDVDAFNRINEDIDRLIDSEVDAISRLRSYSEEQVERVSTFLKTRRDGIFLPVTLILKRLSLSPARDVDFILDHFTENMDDLDDLYEQLVSILPKTLLERPSDILKHLIHTYRPLKVSELAFACGYKHNNGEEELRNTLLLYGPLLRIRVDGDTVEFFHSSARHFLINNSKAPNSKLGKLLLPEGIAQVDLAVSCLQWLISMSEEHFPFPWQDNFGRQIKELLRKSLLLGYAFDYWDLHAQAGLRATRISIPKRRHLISQLDQITAIFRDPTKEAFFQFATQRKNTFMFIRPQQKLTSLDVYSALGTTDIVAKLIKASPVTRSIESDLRKQGEESKSVILLTTRPKFSMAALRSITVKLAQKMAPQRFTQNKTDLVSALYCAANRAHADIFSMLLSSTYAPLLTEKDLKGYIPGAVNGGNTRVLHLLLSRLDWSVARMADVVHYSIKYNRFHVLPWLVEASPCLIQCDEWRRNVLHRIVSMQYGNSVAEHFIRAILFLADHGFNINSTDREGNTILHYVCLDSTLCTRRGVASLIRNGANPGARNRYGWLPIHFAARRAFGTAFSVLLGKSEQALGIASSRGKLTPLHWAMQRRFFNDLADDYEVVKSLLRVPGASLTATSRYGRTPLSIAMENPHMFGVLSDVFFGLDGVMRHQLGSSYSRAMLRDSHVEMGLAFESDPTKVELLVAALDLPLEGLHSDGRKE